MDVNYKIANGYKQGNKTNVMVHDHYPIYAHGKTTGQIFMIFLHINPSYDQMKKYHTFGLPAPSFAYN